MRSLKERKDSCMRRVADLADALVQATEKLRAIEAEETEMQEGDTLRCPPPAGALCE